MTKIHQTAVIEKGAKLDSSVDVGPFCHIGANVEIANDTKIHSHVVIGGLTKIGKKNQVFPFSSLGLAPQDLKFKGEKTELIIGDENIIREHVTMNPGTEGGGAKTVIGNRCLFMVSSHVAHDCVVGNNVILANNATLAGHVHVEDFAIIGGLSAIHQFVRIGSHAMIGGMSGIESDVIPYGSALGERASLAGLNIVGLKRRGFERDDIHALRSAYRLLFSSEGTMAERITDVSERFKENKVVMEIIKFISQNSQRGVCLPKNEKQN